MSRLMKYIPMLFSESMVRANLAGIKTETRRLVGGRGLGGTMISQPTFLPGEDHGVDDMWSFIEWDSYGEPSHWFEPSIDPIRDRLLALCPYGKPGDRIWQRETLRMDDTSLWRYAADDKPVMVCEEDEAAMRAWAHNKKSDACVSMHMPRFACRFFGERTEFARVERVQDITEEGAIAEGIARPEWDGVGVYDTPTTLSPYYDKSGGRKVFTSARDCYADLWDSLNGKKQGFTWADNPFVYVITYKSVEDR